VFLDTLAGRHDFCADANRNVAGTMPAEQEYTERLLDCRDRGKPVE
jgi:hypothetical protein